MNNPFLVVYEENGPPDTSNKYQVFSYRYNNSLELKYKKLTE